MNSQETFSFLTRYFTGEWGETDEVQLQKWLNTSSENRLVFEQFQSVWENLEPTQKVITDTNQQWEKLSLKLNLPADSVSDIHMPAPKPVLRIPMRRQLSSAKYVRYAVAAVLVIGLLAYQFLMPILRDDLKVMAVGNKQYITMTLPDGSVVQLNSGSQLKYPEEFSCGKRIVYLEGEAFFDIKQNDECPFIVKTEQSKIATSGTSLNIWSRYNETRVAVKNGEAVVHSSEHELIEEQTDECVLLSQNQMTSISTDQEPNSAHLVKMKEVTDWLENRLVFRHTTLQEVIDELERKYDTTIQLENEELGKLKLTAYLKNDSLETVLDAIALALDLKYITKGDRINIYSI